jgi:hypothetical protein
MPALYFVPISIHTVVAMMMIALTHTAGFVVRLAVQVQPQNFHRISAVIRSEKRGASFAT